MSRLTCTDCIHDYVCHNLNNLNYWNKDDPNGDPMDKFCLCFKNKELFIELPCKVGDYVYKLTTKCDKHDCPPISCEVCDFDEQFVGIRKFKFGYEAIYLVEKQLGKTVFLTKAEAEAKLEELKGGTE